MIDSCAGLIALCLEFEPGKGTFLHIQTPEIVNRFGACVTTKGNKEGFGISETMAISSAWGGTNYRDNVPTCFIITFFQIK